ncbi:MAG: hypothetical protein V4577_15985 [Bacteroidota bacterium]
MFSNPRQPIILFILSFAGMMLGLMLKILHWAGGQLITGSMIMVQVIAIVWLIIVVAKTKD